MPGAAGLTHNKVSDEADSLDTELVQPTDWNDKHYFAGANLGALLYQGTDGEIQAINSVASGQVLTSAGAGSVPAWSASPSLTKILVGDGSAGAPSYSFASETNTGMYDPGPQLLGFSILAVPKVHIDSSNGRIRIASDLGLAWNSTSNLDSGAVDVGISRGAANRLTLATGDVFNLAPTAFASLPTGAEGDLACVTDSNTATWGATIAGGGANNVIAFFNGTNWTVMGA